MLIKVCGMREADNIAEVDSLGIDLMGFIFYEESPRFVGSLPEILPQNAGRVAVFVNGNYEIIKQKAESIKAGYVQLHGDESPQLCRSLRKEGFSVIKAFRIGSAGDLEQCAVYENCCDFFLFDTKTPRYGGSGLTFDWQILKSYTGNTRFFLSGGISENDAETLNTLQHPKLAGIDLNSRFEICPALKDSKKLSQFINRLKNNRI